MSESGYAVTGIRLLAPLRLRELEGVFWSWRGVGL